MSDVKHTAAFPLSDERLPSHEGMSLRDYFAAQAIVGIAVQWPWKMTPVTFAERAYAIADAMLAESKK